MKRNKGNNKGSFAVTLLSSYFQRDSIYSPFYTYALETASDGAEGMKV